RKRKAREREQREHGISNIRYCFHVLFLSSFFCGSFSGLVFLVYCPFTEVLSQIRSEVTRKAVETCLPSPRWWAYGVSGSVEPESAEQRVRSSARINCPTSYRFLNKEPPRDDSVAADC